MRAVVINSFGPAFDLSWSEVDDLHDPAPRQLLIRVAAAGLNRADLLQSRGAYPPPPGYSPNRPGLEFAGEVVAVGSDAGEYAVGDRVFGISAGEAQAEYLLTDYATVARIPDNLDLEAAAAVPEAFITAHDAIFTQAQLRKGETLLIHAVGSGVGLAALQIAREAGCKVIGTSRTASKLERCRDYGSLTGITIDDPSNFAARIREITAGRGADVILDLVGGAYFAENLRSLGDLGRLCVVGLTSGREASIDLGLLLQRRARIFGTVLRPRSVKEKGSAVSEIARDVLPLLARGEVRPVVDRVFDAEDVRAAYEYLGSNQSFGKVILRF